MAIVKSSVPRGEESSSSVLEAAITTAEADPGQGQADREHGPEAKRERGEESAEDSGQGLPVDVAHAPDAELLLAEERAHDLGRCVGDRDPPLRVPGQKAREVERLFHPRAEGEATLLRGKPAERPQEEVLDAAPDEAPQNREDEETNGDAANGFRVDLLLTKEGALPARDHEEEPEARQSRRVGKRSPEDAVGGPTAILVRRIHGHDRGRQRAPPSRAL